MKLTAQTRTAFGKQVAALRASGHVPAEVYGHGTPNMHVSVPRKELGKVMAEAGRTGVITLDVDGKGTRVMVHDFVRDSRSDDVLHVDFIALKAGEKIHAHVPVVFVGEAPAIKEGLGVLVKNLHEVEVSALPEKLPHEFTVDVSALAEAGAAIHVSDIAMPAEVTLVTEPETVVVSIGALQAEEVEEAPQSVEDVAVEGEEKRAEEAAETKDES